MTEDALTLVRTHLEERKLQDLMQKSQKFRHRARRAFLRIAMACPNELVDGNNIAWDKVTVDAATLDQPVTEGELEAWLSPERPLALVQRVGRLLHLQLAEPITVERYLELVANQAPLHFARVFEGQTGFDASELVRRLLQRFEGPWVDSLIATKRPSGNLGSRSLDVLSGESLGRLLESIAANPEDVPNAYVLRNLDGGAASAPDAFVTIAKRSLSALEDDDVSGLWLDFKEVPATAIAALLAHVEDHDARFERLAFLVARAQTAAAADAFARFLGSETRGRAAARWLAVLGPEGRRATRDAAAAQPESARVQELAAAILKLPEATSFLLNMDNKADSSWHLDSRQFLFEPPPRAERASHEPISLKRAEQALSAGDHDREDLTASEWADLLQIVCIRGWREDLAWAREQASSDLGFGADPARLVAAIEHFNFDETVRLGYGSDGALGLYHFLIGADAPIEVMLHALAIYAHRSGATMMGCIPRNFEAPLKAWQPAKHEALLLHARHLEVAKHNRVRFDEILRFPTLEETSSAGAQWTSSSPHSAFRLRVTLTGATKATLHFLGCALHVDIAKGRWSHEGLGGGNGGPISLLGHEPAVHIGVETFGGKCRIGVGGTLVGNMPDGYLFEDIGDAAAPVTIETDGAIARARITGAGSQRSASDHAHVIGFSEASSIDDVAGAEDATAALTLATAAALSDDDSLRTRAREALATMSDVATPWRDALRVAKEEAQEIAFPLRAFEDCVAAFEEVLGKTPEQEEHVQGYARAVALENPSNPEWSEDAIAEDSLYLVEGDKWQGEGVNDIQTLMSSSIPAVTTWNSGGSGSWAGEPGTWLILQCDNLMQEQDEWGGWMSLTLAAWKVEEGVALAAWKGSREKLAKVMGLSKGWPSRRAWKSIKVWIGE
ncbi:MAG: hypothetical protein AAGE52_12825 [Myxococcota bacterium]